MAPETPKPSPKDEKTDSTDSETQKKRISSAYIDDDDLDNMEIAMNEDKVFLDVLDEKETKPRGSRRFGRRGR